MNTLRSLVLLVFTLTASMLMLSGCEKSSGECSEKAPCGGFATCVDGTCVAKSCSSSVDCGMESYCDIGECAPGCQSTDDCLPGDVCDAAGACIEGECRDTSLDCAFKEFCDPASGDCYEASGYYCKACQDPGPSEDCGGNGNYCLNFGANGSFCGVTCDTTSDCPSGFDCVGLSDGNGNIVTNQCLTYCWLYITDGARGPDAPDPASPALPPVLPDPIIVPVASSEVAP